MRPRFSPAPGLWIALLTMLAATHAHATLIIHGPDLTGGTVAWYDAGIRFTALRNTRIESFTFQNQGRADTIDFADGTGHIFASIAVPAGNPQFALEVDWPLLAGSSYELISHDGDNGRWADFLAYPVSNADIRIDSSVGRENEIENYWFNFTDIQTLGHAPEPATIVLLLPMLLLRSRWAR